ncbi:2-hydroxyacid dehydrogenase [Clostridium polyendosporum]|uniref:2-hydroxyacid dehydrogenase n=1 Tax=Clostridium polyendosporum TaxID=69208 RepID=A0A919RXT3_9CLOT|nr:D-2-hydroxyacid dehydrogenase [Clostridium polyendosporum]GIM27415.1 2-hydroxyacid dehydrogenase [Clostridium polyendosporum]
MKIVILDSKTLGDDADLSLLEKFGEVIAYGTTEPHEVGERICDADVILANKVILDRFNLANALKVKLICITATGTNNVDLNYAKEMGIAVTNVAGYSTNSVVQHTFACLFYILENLKYYDEYVKSNQYSKSPLFTNLDKPFWELCGKTWGIIGLGEIGRNVASIAKAFGCRVIYFSTSGKNTSTDFERVNLETLLKESDIVSIHSPLNEATKGLLDYTKLCKMKNTSILLNMGRGGIVDEEGLAKALDENKIWGAGLDVLSHEPIKEENPLLNISRKEKLIITPHIAWASIEARERLLSEVAKNIAAFLNNEKRNRVE